MTATMTRLAPTSDKRCGTLAGYSRHRRLGEDWCALCREAKNTYNRKLRDRKRGGEKLWHTPDRVLDLMQITAGWWDVPNLCSRLGASDKAVAQALHRMKREGLVENRKVWRSPYDQTWEWRAVHAAWEVD